MSTSSFAGAPVSKGAFSPSSSVHEEESTTTAAGGLTSLRTLAALLSVAVACSIVAAVTSTQHLFHLPLVPHLIRDHQFYRLLAHHFVYANSAELLLGTLLLWQTSAEVERLFGTRKFAVRLQPDLGAPTSRLTSSLVPQSFLVVTTALSTAATAVTLLLGARLTRGQFNFFPSGPFAATAAILYALVLSHKIYTADCASTGINLIALSRHCTTSAFSTLSLPSATASQSTSSLPSSSLQTFHPPPSSA